MFAKRYRIALLFNANKAYDRQLIEGVGEYLQASQCEWDIFIEEDFRCRLEHWQSDFYDGVIADFDDLRIRELLSTTRVPVVATGGSYYQPQDYPPVHYIATDNQALVEAAYLHLRAKGISRFAFYGLPVQQGKQWALERELAFRRLMSREHHQHMVYQGMEIVPDNWQYAQNRLADWLQSLPLQTGIIAVTDARARHLLQVCEHLDIAVPEKLSAIGIDNEEMTRYLSRVALSSVVQGTHKMGYLAAKLLHKLFKQPDLPLQRILVPPVKVVARRSTDFRSLRDPAVIQALHFIRTHACRGIKVEQVLEYVGLSRSNLEKRFKDETEKTIHSAIHDEKLERARECLCTTSLTIHEISQVCGYPSVPYFYAVFKKSYGLTPKEYRERHGEKEVMEEEA